MKKGHPFKICSHILVIKILHIQSPEVTSEHIGKHYQILLFMTKINFEYL